MGFDLSERAKSLAKRTEKNIQLILRIEDANKDYSTLQVKAFWKIGDPYTIGQVGLLIGGTIDDATIDPYIMLSGTTSQITQQLSQDKDGGSSVSNMTIQLIDRDNLVSKELNAITPDILSKRADIFLGFQQGTFPDDFVTIFTGSIVDFNTDAGTVQIRVANPERLKNQEVYPKISVALNGAIDSTQTTIDLTSSAGLLLPTATFLTYVRIEDEIIRYAGITLNQLTGCTRGQFNTSNVAHDDDTDVDSFYKVTGSPIDLALQIMLSSDSTYYLEDYTVSSIVDESISNSIWFDSVTMIDYYNITVGDTIAISGSINPMINDQDWIITSMGMTATRTWFTVYDVPSGPFPEVPTTATASFKSQYNILPSGCGMMPYEIDIEQHRKIKGLFGSSFPDLTFYLKDTVKAKEFIDSEIYFPVGAYSLPRKGKVSLGYTAPPIAELNTKTLNQDNVMKPSSIKIKRSSDKYLYNAIVYKFEESAVDERFLRGSIYVSEDSNNKIRVGNKPLTIESKGIRKGGATDTFIAAQSLRFLDRYKYGAESFELEIDYGTGYSIEAGDSVIFDGTNLQMFDSKNGTRSFDSRVMEVINKSLDIKTGQIKLSLLDTAYSVSARYATIAPSSYLYGSPAPTTTFLPLRKSPSNLITGAFENEKWQGFIGQLVRVHSIDYTYDETTTIVGFDPVYKDAMIVEALPTAPADGYIVEAPEYAGKTTNLWATLHGYLNPYVTCTGGIDNFSFTVASGDVYKLFVGSYVKLAMGDYSLPTSEAVVSNISGTTITVETDMGLTPDNSYFIDLIGFSQDKKVPYRYL